MPGRAKTSCSGATAGGLRLEDTHWQDVAVEGVRLADVVFAGCRLTDVHVTGRKPGIREMERARFENCRFADVKFHGCTFADTTLRNVEVSDLDVRDVDFAGATIDGTEAFLRAIGQAGRNPDVEQ